MNRLQDELTRLYRVPDGGSDGSGAPPDALVSPSGRVRALVMELVEPPDWDLLGKVWRGVQSDWALPAPAIAVSGRDGLQLWFSVAEPVADRQAHAFLEGLRQQYLPDIDARRVRLYPRTCPAGPQDHAPLVPAQQVPTGNWSAFLAVDLVPIFAETPWLDIPPGDEGQASLLQGLDPIALPAFEAVLDRLSRDTPPPPADDEVVSGASVSLGPAHGGTQGPDADPRQFLTRVMQDASVPLALRIEAAKALLQHAPTPAPRMAR